MKVIDVGAAPGGWSQIIADKIEDPMNQVIEGSESLVAIDLLEMADLAGVKLIQGNISDEIT